MNYLILPTIFLFLTPFIILANSAYLESLRPPSKYSVQPQTLGVEITVDKDVPTSTIHSTLTTADARPIILTNYFKYYNSPLINLSQYIVQTSDKYRLDFRLLPAIAMQESNLCLHIPPESHNCWGYGIYGDQVIKFASYEAAIDQVAKTLAREYLARGLTTPEEIMRKYTPPSDGSWANGVNYFLDIMEKGGNPDDQ